MVRTVEKKVQETGEGRLTQQAKEVFGPLQKREAGAGREKAGPSRVEEKGVINVTLTVEEAKELQRMVDEQKTANGVTKGLAILSTIICGGLMAGAGILLATGGVSGAYLGAEAGQVLWPAFLTGILILAVSLSVECTLFLFNSHGKTMNNIAERINVFEPQERRLAEMAETIKGASQ